MKIVLSPYLSRKSSEFNEIWYADADFVSKVGCLTKFQNFANSKWRTAAILRIVFRLYMNDLFLINAKFRTKEHNYIQTQIT